MTTLLTAKFAQVDASILDILSSNRLPPKQTHGARLTTASNCNQSSKRVNRHHRQVDTALLMLHHVDPSQVGTFKDAIDLKFGTLGDRHFIPSRHCTDAADRAGTDCTHSTGKHRSRQIRLPAIDVQVTTDTPAAVIADRASSQSHTPGHRGTAS